MQLVGKEDAGCAGASCPSSHIESELAKLEVPGRLQPGLVLSNA